MKAQAKRHYYLGRRIAVKLNTVNVIEITNGSDLQSIHSFADNARGNRAAERLFKFMVKDSHIFSKLTKEDFNEIVDEGYWDTVNYWVGITHSV